MSFPLFVPLLLILIGMLIAFSYGLPTINKRFRILQVSWLLSLFPLTAFGTLLFALSWIQNGQGISWQTDWLLFQGLRGSLYFDSLSAVFALLITGIGTLVVIYSGYYFKDNHAAWRFLGYLLLFMFAMLGLVMAGNLLVLFIFWEITSVVSFLLVAYKTESEQARKSAFKALLITGSGGIALLLGVILIAAVAGTTEISTLLAGGDLLRESVLYPAMLLLIALASFTKSAQTPFHIWLPEAMSAPTPASAYLHSATMVKAGIYLLARLNPVLGQTESWFWVFSSFGLITMLAGAYLGLKQNDLKALLAYSTISQLGMMVLLIGQDTDIAFKALIIGVIAHALYKSALFLVAGIVDHETGTRDLRRLGGLRRWMPYSALIALLAALSMAGLPPMFGFLAKETLLATAVHPSLPGIIAAIFPVASVIAGALILVQAGLFVWDTFLGQRRDPSLQPHEAPWGMLVAPFVPASLSILLGLLPEPQQLASFIADAASAAYGGEVKVSLALWAGLTVPVLLSIIAVSCGIVLFIYRARLRVLLGQIAPDLSINSIYTRGVNLIDYSASLAVRLQGGKLRTYITIMLFSLIILVVFFAGIPDMDFNLLIQQPRLDINFALSILRLFALVVVISAAAASVFIRRDFAAILTLGAMGLGVAVLIVLEPAPDVALVQIIVDLLAVVILVLALTRLPRSQRVQAMKLTYKQSRPGLIRDILVSAGVGGIVAWIALIALITRPRENILTSFYEANAKLLTGAKDIVGAIVVDFRAFDTLIEITVFSIAGLGIFTLLLYASRWAGDQVSDESTPAANTLDTTGIGGAVTSSFIHALAYFSLPFSMILALTHILYGHDQPGDGFTAGVIVGLVIAFWYVVFGYTEVKARLRWLKPTLLISSGILLAVLSGTLAALINGNFLSNVDFGALLNIPLPTGIYLSTSLLFETAIFLSVLGSISYVLSALGHPRLSDNRSETEIKSLDQAGESSKAPPSRSNSAENSSLSRDTWGEQSG